MVSKMISSKSSHRPWSSFEIELELSVDSSKPGLEALLDEFRRSLEPLKSNTGLQWDFMWLSEAAWLSLPKSLICRFGVCYRLLLSTIILKVKYDEKIK